MLIDQFNRFARVSIDTYCSTKRVWKGVDRHLLNATDVKNTLFWPDWNSYVRLGVFHNIFGTKGSRSILFPKICLKFLIIGFLASVAYSVAQ